jgi:hypothetical protein
MPQIKNFDEVREFIKSTSEKDRHICGLRFKAGK